MENTKKKGLFDNVAPVVVLFAIATLAVGISLLRDDVLSTAETMYTYFPQEFGVYPAMDFTGAIVLGLFVSVVQMVSLVVATSPAFDKNVRVIAWIVYGILAFLDGWTDVIHRSNKLKGDVGVSVGVTLGFYTLGSEFSSSLAIAVIATFWRKATSDVLFGWAQISAFLSNIAREYSSYRRAANNRESKYLNERAKEVGDFREQENKQGNGQNNNQQNNNRQNSDPLQNTGMRRLPPGQVEQMRKEAFERQQHQQTRQNQQYRR